MFNFLTEMAKGPPEQLSRRQHVLFRGWELTRHCWRQLQRHRAEGMAAELTYRTIFSLIPVVVLSLVMFRIVGGLDEVQDKVEDQMYSFFGVPEITGGYASSRDINGNERSDAKSKPATGSTANPSVAPEKVFGADDDIELSINFDEAISVAEIEAQAKEEVRVESARQTRASIRRSLSEVTAKVASIDFKSIGVFGLMLFVYAAVALADAAEHLFNRIYDAPSKRPVHIRLAIHWSMITLGSGLLAMSLYMSGQFMDWFVEIGAGTASRRVLSHLFSILASWVLLFLLYALMPNTHVAVRAAAIGSLVGSLLWELAKFGFQIYVAKAVPYSAVYGSIGLIPLFLFWIYITWLIVLFGLILTHTLQTIDARRDEDEPNWDKEPISAVDPNWMLPIMIAVGVAFNEGDAIDNQLIADRIGLSGRVVHDMTRRLIDGGLLRRVAVGISGDETLTLSRPAEKISVIEILELGYRDRPTSDHPAWRSLAMLKKAEFDAASGKTLADVS